MLQLYIRHWHMLMFHSLRIIILEARGMVGFGMSQELLVKKA